MFGDDLVVPRERGIPPFSWGSSCNQPQGISVNSVAGLSYMSAEEVQVPAEVDDSHMHSGSVPAAKTIAACVDNDRFETLLRELADERNRELAELRREVSRLRGEGGDRGNRSRGRSTCVLTASEATEMTNLVSQRFTQSKFILLPDWLEANWRERSDVRGTLKIAGAVSPTDSIRHLSSDSTEIQAPSRGLLQRWIAYPSSSRQQVWDLIGLAMIMYDVVWMPIALTFSPPNYPLIDVINWVSLLYWTLNVPATLLVGCVVAGETLMEPRAILWNYLKTWCALDAITVLPDWYVSVTELRGDGENSTVQASKFLNLLRIVRIVRLLRLLRIQKLLQTLHDMVESEYTGVIVSVAKMIVLLLMLNHALSCLWWLVGSVDRTTSWISALSLQHAHWSEQYAWSFHWGITQFTPSSMPVQPENLGERCFAVSVVVFALVFFSYIVGSITGSLSQIRIMREDEFKQLWQLRRFMRQHRVRLVLARRIQRYVESRFKTKKQLIPIQTLKTIPLLSTQLLSELKSELCADQLGIHPLFFDLSRISRLTMHRLSHKAVQRKSLACRDLVFNAGERGRSMLYCTSGRFVYERSGGQREVVDNNQSWAVEQALWTLTWFHLGTMSALAESEIMDVEGRSFCDTVSLDPVAYRLAAEYARQYVQWLNTLSVDEASDISSEDDATRARMFLPNRSRRARHGEQSYV